MKKRVSTTVCLCLPSLLAPVLHAESPVPLNEHLKPIARYLGNWIWQWKDEHGQSKTGQSVVEVDPSGNFLVDRAGDIRDGKLVTSELNIYYWRPELKAIATAGFTSDGDRGTSIMFVRGHSWLENSSGYDEQGKLRTHIDQWTWSGDDSVDYQETHIFRAGLPEPDDVKLSSKRAPADSMLSDKSAERQPLDPNLKALSRLLGKWRTEAQDNDGDAVKGELTVQADRSGAFVTQKAVARNADNEVIWSQFTIYYWQPESKSLAEVTFERTGGRKSAVIFPRGDSWVEHVVRYDEEGQITTSIDQWKWSNDRTAVWQSTHVFVQGESAPDTPSYTLKRVD
jgi:hypothetical protein